MDQIHPLSLLIGAVASLILGIVYEKRVSPWFDLRKLRQVLPVQDLPLKSSIRIRPSLEIIVAGSPKRSKRAYTHSCEVLALHKLYGKLHGLPVNISADYSETIQMVDANWILLGLRRNNPLSETMVNELMARTDLALVVSGGGEPYFRSSTANNEASFKCEHDGDRVTKDYGIIYRKTMGTGNIWLLCAGIHMYGTQAALEIALNPDFIRKIRKNRCTQFIQLVEVEVDKSGIMINPDIKWKTLPLICIEPSPSLLERASSLARSLASSAHNSRGHSSG